MMAWALTPTTTSCDEIRDAHVPTIINTSLGGCDRLNITPSSRSWSSSVNNPVYSFPTMNKQMSQNGPWKRQRKGLRVFFHILSWFYKTAYLRRLQPLLPWALSSLSINSIIKFGAKWPSLYHIMQTHQRRGIKWKRVSKPHAVTICFRRCPYNPSYGLIVSNNSEVFGKSDE